MKGERTKSTRKLIDLPQRVFHAIYVKGGEPWAGLIGVSEACLVEYWEYERRFPCVKEHPAARGGLQKLVPFIV